MLDNKNQFEKAWELVKMIVFSTWVNKCKIMVKGAKIKCLAVLERAAPVQPIRTCEEFVGLVESNLSRNNQIT